MTASCGGKLYFGEGVFCCCGGKKGEENTEDEKRYCGFHGVHLFLCRWWFLCTIKNGDGDKNEILANENAADEA